MTRDHARAGHGNFHRTRYVTSIIITELLQLLTLMIKSLLKPEMYFSEDLQIYQLFLLITALRSRILKTILTMSIANCGPRSGHVAHIPRVKPPLHIVGAVTH